MLQKSRSTAPSVRRGGEQRRSAGTSHGSRPVRNLRLPTSSADARELLAVEPVDKALSARKGRHFDDSGVLFRDAPDHGRVCAVRVGAKRNERLFGVFLGKDDEELSFVCDVERIEPQKFAGGRNGTPL